jgi:hypothetical protein
MTDHACEPWASVKCTGGSKIDVMPCIPRAGVVVALGTGSVFRVASTSPLLVPDETLRGFVLIDAS